MGSVYWYIINGLQMTTMCSSVVTAFIIYTRQTNTWLLPPLHRSKFHFQSPWRAAEIRNWHRDSRGHLMLARPASDRDDFNSATSSGMRGGKSSVSFQADEGGRRGSLGECGSQGRSRPGIRGHLQAALPRGPSSPVPQ